MARAKPKTAAHSSKSPSWPRQQPRRSRKDNAEAVHLTRRHCLPSPRRRDQGLQERPSTPHPTVRASRPATQQAHHPVSYVLTLNKASEDPTRTPQGPNPTRGRHRPLCKGTGGAKTRSTTTSTTDFDPASTPQQSLIAHAIKERKSRAGVPPDFPRTLATFPCIIFFRLTLPNHGYLQLVRDPQDPHR